MSLTEEQIEQIADRMRGCGFEIENLDNEQIALIADCVLEGLGINFEN